MFYNYLFALLLSASSSTKSTVAETGDKSATKSTVADTVDFVADAIDFVALQCLRGQATRSTLSTFNKVDRSC